MIRTLNIHFGALSDPIAKQVKSQGFQFNGKQMITFQEQSDAILKLRFAGILTDSMMDKAHAKLFQHIKKHVQGSLKENASGSLTSSWMHGITCSSWYSITKKSG